MTQTRAALEARSLRPQLLTDFGGRIVPDSVRPADS